MPKRIDCTCLDCGAKRRVWRFELDRAAKPRCLKCGGSLSMSFSGRESLAGANDAKDGRGVPKRKTKDPAVERIIPHREAGRYDFWPHPTLYEWALKDGSLESSRSAVQAAGPFEFYQRYAANAVPVNHEEDGFASLLVRGIEADLFKNHRPYYKVWPSIASALCHTEMRVDGEFFRMPYDAFEIRLPKTENPVEPTCACVVGRRPNSADDKDRDWSLVLMFFDNVPGFYESDSAGNYWCADIPIRVGLSLEDALSQTALMRECPNPDIARRMMRVAVGVSFFGVDRHETILPEIRRKTIDRCLRERRDPSPSEAKAALKEAKELGMFGFKVGSEIDLPTAIINHHGEEKRYGPLARELTAGHIRRGHMALVPCGEGKQERKLIFRAPTVVRPDLPLQSSHGYRVRVPG
jgi:hypothetical protein